MTKTMKNQRISNVIQASMLLQENAITLQNHLTGLEGEDGKSFDISAVIIQTDSTVAEWIARIQVMDGMIQKFDKGSHYQIVPSSRLLNLESALLRTDDSIKELHDHFSQILNHSGGFSDFNYLYFQVRMRNNQIYDLKDYFKNVDVALESCLDAFLSVVSVLRPTKATFSFQAAANALSSTISEAKGHLAGVKSKETEIGQIIEKGSAIQGEMENIAKEISRLRDEGATDRKTITDYVSEASNKAEAIATVHTDATSLESAVRDFKADFEEFDRQLAKRQDSFSQGKARTEDLIKEIEEQTTSVSELIKQSEEMLKGATVAGLAGQFEGIRREITGELKSARHAFYGGIAFLFVSAIPLMAFVFLPIVAILFQNYFPGLAEGNYPPPVGAGFKLRVFGGFG